MIYVFTEWRCFDDGGMEVESFENRSDAVKWLTDKYTAEELETEMNEKSIRIIDGDEVKPKITEISVIKKIEL